MDCLDPFASIPVRSFQPPHNFVAGNNFQSLGMHQIAEGAESTLTWKIGTGIFIFGALLNFASYAFAAQSMLASLESIQ